MKAEAARPRPQNFDFSVGKWGNGLAMRLGKEAQRALGVNSGDRLQGAFSAQDGETILTLRLAKPAKPRYTLKQLMAGCTNANRHAEDWLNRPPVGREAGGAARPGKRVRG